MADVHHRSAGGTPSMMTWFGVLGPLLALGGIVYSAGWQGSEIGHLRTAVLDQRQELSALRLEARAGVDGVRTELRAGDRTLIELGTRLTRVETTLQGLDDTLRDFLEQARPRRGAASRGRS